MPGLLTKALKARRRRKWPWAKEELLTGERVIVLNDHSGSMIV
jgi:hypothetical protein